MRKRVAFLREFLENPRGSLTVEFVVIAPLLIAALVVSFEFGRAFWAYDVITRDLRAGVRYLSRTAGYSAANQTKAENVAKTGTPAGTTLHFPWTGATCTSPARPAFVYSETPFTAANYSSAGHTFTMTANVPVTLSLLEVLNRLAELVRLQQGEAALAPIATGYCLTVSYQARYIGD